MFCKIFMTKYVHPADRMLYMSGRRHIEFLEIRQIEIEWNGEKFRIITAEEQ